VKLIPTPPADFDRSQVLDDTTAEAAARMAVVPTGSALPVTADPERDGSEEAA
jgi:hypothetical protein